MTRHYSINNLSRQMPNALLARYFQMHGLFGDLDFAEMNEGTPDALFEAWRDLSDTQRNPLEAELRQIFDMSCEKGWLAILDEARWQCGADSEAFASFSDQLSALSSHYARAMITFLDYGPWWKGATRFYHADMLSYWRKRRNLPRQQAAVDTASLRELANLISHYFRHAEGRGQHCVVEPYRRNDLDYFFAFPEDHSQQAAEWVNGEFHPLYRHQRTGGDWTPMGTPSSWTGPAATTADRVPGSSARRMAADDGWPCSISAARASLPAGTATGWLMTVSAKPTMTARCGGRRPFADGWAGSLAS